MFPIKDTNFGPKDKKPYINTVLFSLKQNMNSGGTGCFICLYILSTAFAIKIHLFSVLSNLFLTVPRVVINWEASLFSILLKIKGLEKMNRPDYFLHRFLRRYCICIECIQNATILICCILYTLYPYLVDYLKWKQWKTRPTVVTDRVIWSHLFQSNYVHTKPC